MKKIIQNSKQPESDKKCNVDGMSMVEKCGGD
jgi:hypothetical protein